MTQMLGHWPPFLFTILLWLVGSQDGRAQSGPTRDSRIDQLLGQASDQATKGQFADAFRSNGQADSLLRLVSPLDSMAWSAVLYNLGVIRNIQQQFSEAETLIRQARNIRLEQTQARDTTYAEMTNELASLLSMTGRNDEAIGLFNESLDILKAQFGPDHLYVSYVLNGLAGLLWRTGRLTAADSILQESIRIQQKQLGIMDLQYATSLENRAILQKDLGQYEQAEPLYLEAIRIEQSLLDPYAPQLAIGLSNLAVLYYHWGRYDQAESYYLQSMDRMEHHPDGPPPDLGLLLNNLGALYAVSGQVRKGTDVLERAYTVVTQLYGPAHMLTLRTANNLASSYMNLHRLSTADSLLNDALSRLDTTTRTNSRERAMLLENLGLVHYREQAYDLAEADYSASRDLRLTYLDPGHPEVATCLWGLGRIYGATQRYPEAITTLKEALNMMEPRVTISHPKYAEILHDLGLVYQRSGQDTDAATAFSEAYRLNRELLLHATQYMSQEELEGYIRKFTDLTDDICTWTAEKDGNAGSASLTYDMSLFFKGFLLNVTTTMQHLASRNPDLEPQFRSLSVCHRQLAVEYARDPADSLRILELEARSRDLEKQLARQSRGYGTALAQFTWMDVRQALRPDQAAIEFVRYPEVREGQDSDFRYAALLFQSGSPSPIWIPLTTEDDLDRLFGQTTSRRADYVNFLYTLNDRGLQPDAPASSLFNLIWKPVMDRLDPGVREIIASPVGHLHRVNLAAIPISRTEIVADHYQVLVVNSTRMICQQDRESTAAQPYEAELFGGIAFSGRDTDSTTSFLAGARAGWANQPWPGLPWTEDETKTILHQLTVAGIPAHLRMGDQATEQAFKSLEDDGDSVHRILHLATHGYFFPDPMHEGRDDVHTPLIFRSSPHPMIRSGLILADGNYAWLHGRSRDGASEDGILTAFEISQMDLSHTELVVLSACETGLGDIIGNEGVYGLQRAFKIAGAHYLIMSLWQVPDRETMAFMTTFYRHWLNDGSSIPRAFHQTQLEMRDRFYNPYSWAGFVLVD